MGAKGKKSKTAQIPILSKCQLVSLQRTIPNAQITATPRP
jgi:hypothetical protein